MQIVLSERDELLKANLNKLIEQVGLEEASHYIVTDKTIDEAEKNALLAIVNIRIFRANS